MSVIQSAGPGYQPLTQLEQQRYDMENPMMQGQYPTGMDAYGGQSAFMGAPPMEGDGFTKGPGETNALLPHDTSHGGHGGHNAIDKASGQAPRRCTDIQTCFCFLLYSITAFTLLGVARQHGHRARLTHGTDYFGRVCGVDAGVENMPFLFWCRTDNLDPTSTLPAPPPADIDLDNPTCVPYCPGDQNPGVQIECLRPAQDTQSIVQGGQFGNIQTQVIQMEESVIKTAPYATHPRGGRYCIPKDQTLADKVLSDNRALGPWGHNRLLTVVGTLGHLYWLMFAASIFSLLLGFGFLYAIKHCPYALAKVFMWPLSLMFLLFCAFYIAAIGPLTDQTSGFSDWYVPRNDLFKQWDFQKACWISIGLGLFALMMSLSMFGIAWSFKSIGIADLMNASYDTFRSIPKMMLIPVFEGILKFLVFWAGLQGFSTILAEGYIEKNRIHVNGAKFAGLSRSVTYSLDDFRFWLMGFAWIVLFTWIMEGITALSQFIVSYCTFKYFGVKKDAKGKKDTLPANTVLTGLKYALIYHPGSILKGAFYTPMYRPVRILHWATSVFDGKTKEDTFLKTCMNCVCLPFIVIPTSIQTATTAILQGEGSDKVPIKDAFNDVVIRANDFDGAVGKSHGLLEHSHKGIQTIYRGHNQTTINLIGVTAIASLSSITVFLLVANLDMYKEAASPLFVADPVLVCILTWILCAHIAFGFMTLWDHTADALLYCYAWARKWDRKTVDDYVPNNLRSVVGFDDQHHDRYPYYGKAKAGMYLQTWMPAAGGPAAK